MNKKAIIAVVVLILLVLGAYFVFANKAKAPSTSPALSTSSSLKDLISKGITQSCTFSSANSSGTVYVSGVKVRTDFSTTVDSKVTNSHMIVDGNTSYIWTDGQTTGFKMTFEASGSPSPESTAVPAAGGFDSSANMDYKCKTWIVDSSQFSLPAGVTFTSFGGSTSGQHPNVLIVIV